MSQRPQDEKNITHKVLKEQNELRIEAKGKIVLTMTKGNGEIFGQLLVKNKPYIITNSKIAVFTWTGCEVTIKGKCESIYVSEETPMVSYINTHAALNRMRTDAKAKGNKKYGPVVVIAGPKDSGKSTLAKILLSYAVRCDWKPAFVDLDVGQNEITMPGCIAATPVDEQVGIQSKWSAPLVYYYGHTSPAKNKEIYTRICGKLADAVQKRCQRNASARHSGVIINTSGWIDGVGQQLLLEISKSFKADVVLVIDHEKLLSDLKNSEEIKEMGTTVIKLDKSGGVVARNAERRSELRAARIRSYFYGSVNNKLSPHEKVISFKEVLVYRMGGATRAPASTLPLGQKPMLDPNRVMKVGITERLKNAVLAVSFAKKPEEILEVNIAGLIYVKDVDTKKQKLTILAPSAGNLPHSFLLLGSIQWYDS